MEQWLESVYSDSTKSFVSNPLPKIGEEIRVYIRMYETAPVDHVYLRSLVNGAEHLIEMNRESTKDGLVYYQCGYKINEEIFQYHFYLVTKEHIYYYTQKDITTYLPDHTYDFKILAGYEQPEWVKKSVFYQIFPDRFFNGNPMNDVKTGEYSFAGHETLRVEDWNQPAPKYTEGFCLDFYGGDLEGIKEKISYLKELGVNGIYLNPIFFAATNHKYDCLDYFKVDPHFGGDEALAQLSKELHDNDMKLILDISINHTGTAHQWFNKESTFFPKEVGAYHNKLAKERKYYFFKEDTNEYKAWYNVETLPTLNYTSFELRDIIYKEENSVLKKWLKPPYLIDGWRFDVADVMARNDEVQLHHVVWPEIRTSIKEENPNAFILAENWIDCSEYLQGNEWDSTMNYFGCARPVRQFFGECDLFYRGRRDLGSHTYKLTAKDLSHRIMEHLAKLPTVMQENMFNLIDSHDVPRLHNNPSISWEAYRGAVIMLFTLIGGTSIYYGDEAAIDGRVEDNEGCRYPMPWDKPFMEGKQYQLYQTLAQIKRKNEAFTEGGFRILSDDHYVFSYARFTRNQVFIMVCSNDEEERTINIPIGIFGKFEFTKKEDALGLTLYYELKDGRLLLKTMPYTSYLFEL